MPLYLLDFMKYYFLSDKLIHVELKKKYIYINLLRIRRTEYTYSLEISGLKIVQSD
jgi:hypothetical protein